LQGVLVLSSRPAIQVHGDYGYTREYLVEQFYRDKCLNSMHDGTHRIQALDLAITDGGARRCSSWGVKYGATSRLQEFPRIKPCKATGMSGTQHGSENSLRHARAGGSHAR